MGNLMEILKKHSALISVNSRNVTITQKKALNLFYKTAKESLEKGQELSKWHKVNMRDIKGVLGEDIEVNIKRLKADLKKLTTISVEYNILEKDKKIWGAFSLLTEVMIELNEDGENIVRYKLAEMIENNLVMPNVFAKIDLGIIKNLKSKYAVIMYEIFEDYKNVNVPKMKIEDFKELMGVEENQYTLTADLKKRVIEVVKDEINEKTNFTVDYELIKTGRKYTGIQWRIVDYDNSKQNKYFEKMEFIEFVRNNYKEGDILLDDREKQGVLLIIGKNGLLAKKYDWKDKAETVKKDLAQNAWNWLFENQNRMEKPRSLFRI